MEPNPPHTGSAMVTDVKPAEPEDPEYVELMGRAKILFQEGDFAGAKALYTQVILDPRLRSTVAYCNRSLANFKLDLPMLSLKDADAIERQLEQIQLEHPGITVRDVPGMGRGLFATRQHHKGELILVEEPFVAAFAHGDRCQHCFQELARGSTAAVTCERCNTDRYCTEIAWNRYHEVLCPKAEELENMRASIAEAGQTTTSMCPLVIVCLIAMTLKDPSYRTLLLPEMQLLSPPPSTGHRGSKASAGTIFWSRQRLVDALGLQDDPRFDME